MDKNKRNIIVASVLVVIFVSLILRNFVFQKAVPRASHVPALLTTAATTGNLSALVRMRQNDSIYQDQWKRWEGDWTRDPFMPEAGATTGEMMTETDHLVLQGVFWDEQNPKAILNDKMIGNGDTLGAYKVVEIKPRSVVLSTGEKNIEIQVFNSLSPVKTPENQAS